MAYSISKLLCTVIAIFIITLITLFLAPQLDDHVAVKLPFHPRDLLPLLPRLLSWPVLKSLHTAEDIMPVFVGYASSTSKNTLEWKGACFYDNTAWLEFHNKTGSEFGGGTLHIKVVIPKMKFIIYLDSFFFFASFGFQLVLFLEILSFGISNWFFLDLYLFMVVLN